MSSEETNLGDLLSSLDRAGREYAGRSVMFHQAIADRMGLNVTDLKCLDLARDGGEITPGRLAELTGLTSGSVTAVIDRLERAGYVRRVRDPHDRRKVIVEPLPDRVLPRLVPIFESLSRRMAEELGGRYGRAELALILDFMERSGRVLQAETARLREAAADEKGP